MTLFFLFLTSVICALGFSVVFVEKRFDWPVRPANLRSRWMLRRLHPLLRRLPQCVVCTAFWAAMLSDCTVFVATRGHYWMWPMSGFAASGMAWFGIEFLNAVEKGTARREDDEV